MTTMHLISLQVKQYIQKVAIGMGYWLIACHLLYVMIATVGYPIMGYNFWTWQDISKMLWEDPFATTFQSPIQFGVWTFWVLTIYILLAPLLKYLHRNLRHIMELCSSLLFGVLIYRFKINQGIENFWEPVLFDAVPGSVAMLIAMILSARHEKVGEQDKNL